jgi:hypothetical protein
VLKAVATGVLTFGTSEVDCYVLEDGQRVISTKGIQAGIGASKNGHLDRLLDKLPEKYRPDSVRPSIEFVLPTGGVASGRDRKAFVDICDAYSAAWADGKLHPKQEAIAKSAMAIIRSLAHVGIDALIDEATGYQKVRENDYLRRLFDFTLRQEAAKWEIMFPPAVPRALAPLWKVHYVSGPHPKELQRVYGQIYDLVLGKDTAKEMRSRNIDPKSIRHHQLLQKEPRRLLGEDLQYIIWTAKQSGSKSEFWKRLRYHYRNEPLQLGLISP